MTKPRRTVAPASAGRKAKANHRHAFSAAAGLTFFRMIAEHGTDVASVHKRDGEFVFVAPTALRLFGWSDRDLLGDSLVALCHESDQLKLQLALRVESGSTERVAYRVRCADGQERWVESVVQSGPTADLVLCMTRDVTEHKKTSLSLERGLRMLMERAPEAMMVVQDGRVKQANAAAIEQLRLRSDDAAVGRTLRGFLHHEDADRELDALGDVEADKGASLPLHDVRFVRSGGEVIAAQSFAVAVAHGGRSAVLLAFHARRETDQLVEERLRALGALASELARDLAGPLALLASSIDLVANAASDPSREAERDLALDEARQASDRALVALRALRRFARGETPERAAPKRSVTPTKHTMRAPGVVAPVTRGSMRASARPPRTTSKNTLRAGRKPTVLIVDDEPNLGSSLQRVLRSDFDVSFETSAHAVLRRVEAGERFDVIVCDVMLAGMSGLELHEELARAAPLLATRMLFMSGGLSMRPPFTPESSARHLDKPFSPDELRAKLREMTARR